MVSRARLALIAFVSTTLIGAASNDASSKGIYYAVRLTGETQSNFAHPLGGTGDKDGSGSVTLTINPERKTVCYDFTLSGISTPMMAHIHHGPPLRNGPPVVTLYNGMGSELEDCVKWRRNQLAEIVAKPSDFYVSIATTEFPDGALRGQLPEA